MTTQSRRPLLLLLGLVAAGLAGWLFLRPEPAGDCARVLAILPMTGKGASLGAYIRDGIELYRAEHSESRLDVQLEDSQTDATHAISVYQQSLHSNRPGAVISALSAVTGALAPVAGRDRMLVVGINVSSEKVLAGLTNTQRINDRSRDIASPLGTYAAKRHSTASILYSNEDFGLACKASFEAAYTAGSGKVLSAEPYELKEKDVRTSVLKVIEPAPLAIFVTGYGDAFIAVLKALRSSGYAGQVFAEINFSNPDVLNALGESAEGVVFTALEIALTQPRTDLARRFVERFRTKFGRDPSFGSAYVYDALALLEHVQAQAKPFAQSTFQEVRQWNGVAGKLELLPGGDCRYEFLVLRREGGKNVLAPD